MISKKHKNSIHRISYPFKGQKHSDVSQEDAKNQLKEIFEGEGIEINIDNIIMETQREFQLKSNKC